MTILYAGTDFAARTAGNYNKFAGYESPAPLANTVSGATATPDGIDRLALVADPAGSGSTVLRAYITSSDPVGAFSASNRRTQVEYRPQSSHDDIATEYWHRFRYYVPTDWVGFKDSALTVLQLHDNPDGGDPGREPPLRLEIIDEHVEIWQAYESLGVASQLIQSWELRRGAWQELVVRINATHAAGGELEIWDNGNKVWSYTGPNAYDDVDGLYAIMCVYLPNGWLAGGPTSRTLYFDDYQLGSAAYDTYDAFVAACGSSGTEKESFVTRGVSL